MTLIVAWGDPFWLVADSRGLSEMFAECLPEVHIKIGVISPHLALGLAGAGDDLKTIVARVRREAPKNWAALALSTQGIVSGINAGRNPRLHASIVIAGTVGGERDMFACGPLSGMAGTDSGVVRTFVFAGTGGLQASRSLEETTAAHPEITGEELLRTIVLEAERTDPGTGKPIYRFVLDDEATEPEVWLP